LNALEPTVESLQQQLAFAESIHKVAVQQRDTAWAALNDREKHIDHLKVALAERHCEVLTWERRYKDLIAEYANAVALRAPAPIVINAPPGAYLGAGEVNR